MHKATLLQNSISVDWLESVSFLMTKEENSPKQSAKVSGTDSRELKNKIIHTFKYTYPETLLDNSLPFSYPFQYCSSASLSICSMLQ